MQWLVTGQEVVSRFNSPNVSRVIVLSQNTPRLTPSCYDVVEIGHKGKVIPLQARCGPEVV